MQYGTISLDQTEIRLREFVAGVYGWMAGGLALTAGIGMWIANSPQALIFLAQNPWLIWVLFIAQLALVISIGVPSLNGIVSTILYIAYSALTGVTLSGIFLVYTKSSIALAFFSTAGMFGVMALYGYTTKKDLTRMGQILFMALIGIVIASLINLFFRSNTFEFIISILGVVIFSGLIAYDNQKIKQIGEQACSLDENAIQKFTVVGALALYLDFINLFLILLRLLGERRE